MNKKLFFRAFLFISIAILSFSKTFAQMSEADFKRTYDLAESDMLYENYKAGLKKWLVLHQYDSTNANIDFKIGYTYLMLKSEKSKAVYYLEEAVKGYNPKYKEMEIKEKGAPDYAYYFLGKAYHLHGEIDKAMVAYNKYKEVSKLDKSSTKDVDRQIEMCNNAKEIMAHPVNLSVVNLGDSINSKFPDYAPVVSADEETIIFTSRREGSTGEEMTEDNTYFEDIYISHKLDSGWSAAQHIGSNINTNGHEATINMSVDGQQVFIYKDDGGDGNIYVSQLIGSVWTVPQKLPEGINSKHWETHAALSADARTLYFVSDRPGGIGGRDIYSVKKMPDGNWSTPKNLGPSINTPYDEDAVYLHPDGQHMFFASEGHKSMGGFDIFSTIMSDDGSYTTPENVGYPINTTDDDVFFVVSADGKRAYYSSAHEIGVSNKKIDDKSHGEKDIFILHLVDQDVSNVTIVKGIIRPGNDNDILNSVQIELADNANNEPEQFETKVNSKSGKFLIILPQGKTYKLTYNLGKYGTFTDTIMVPPDSPYREIEKEFDLSQPDPTVIVSKYLVAVNDSATTLVNTPVDVTVLSNDYSKKGKILANTVTVVAKPKSGTVAVSESGIITYTPNKGFAGDDVFTYNYKNSQKKISNDATVKINVGYILTKDISANTIKNTPVSIAVLDKENCQTVNQPDQKSLKVVGNPANGKVEIEKGTGKIKYTPNKDFVGTDTFSFEFSDNKKHKSKVTNVTIDVKEGDIVERKEIPSNSGNCQSLNKEYVKYFKYNKKDIPQKQKEFKEFITSLSACLKEGKVTIVIESSASKVPTTKYKTNENLAKQRAKEANDEIVQALKAIGGNVDNLTFEKAVTLVQGPKYRNDFMVKRATYEKYQYTKITVR